MSPRNPIVTSELRNFVLANPLDEIALTSSLLGVLLGVSVAVLPFIQFKSVCLYLISLSLFHFLEFYITARFNGSKVNKDSFLINNGITYILAHIVAITEAVIEIWLFPNFKRSYPVLQFLGFALVVFGQIMRSMAMITAGESFSHIISQKKKEGHVLVTEGVYSISRHPSYTGFFYWAIGTELMLMNPVCIGGFCIVLWKFFHDRIVFEERYLINFFGDDYIKYRQTTRTWIPFI